MNPREVIAGIAKYSAVGVALSLGEPFTILDHLMVGVAGGVLTQGLSKICGRLVEPVGENHDVQLAFAKAVQQAAHEAAKGNILIAYQDLSPQHYESYTRDEQKALATFCQNLKHVTYDWKAAAHITQGFTEEELQQMAQLPDEKARAYATNVFRAQTLAHLPEHFATYFAEQVSQRVTYYFWEFLKDPKTGTQPWRVFVRNSLRDLHGLIEKVAADQQAVLNMSEIGLEDWVERKVKKVDEEHEKLSEIITEELKVFIAEQFLPPDPSLLPQYELSVSKGTTAQLYRGIVYPTGW